MDSEFLAFYKPEALRLVGEGLLWGSDDLEIVSPIVNILGLGVEAGATPDGS